ncbi:MAG: rhodanese-like domain-containing protein [Bdellovibrionota bacterium]
MIQNKTQNTEGFWEISPETLLENKAQLRLIDVRRPDEYSGELGHIAGAELVTLETEFQKLVETWDKEKPIAFICRSGGRSGKATAYAQALGFKEVYNMQGGMLLWNAKALPVEK